MIEPRKILIVEDDLNTARPLGALLQRRGFAVRTASSVAQAMNVLDEFTPDVALCDYSLEGDEDGACFARRLQAKLPETRIIFLSSHPAAMLQNLLRDVEVDGLLTKPATVDEVLRCVDDSLRN